MKRFLFYFLNLTWGLPLNIVGGLVAFALLIARKKPKRWGDCFYFEVGEGWGGVNFGLIIITDKTFSISCLNHEHGHAIQNCFLGVFMPFIVSIPSAIRYHYRNYREKKGLVNKTDYDAVWYEYTATKLGTKYVKGVNYER
jgi:hypothetical protein